MKFEGLNEGTANLLKRFGVLSSLGFNRNLDDSGGADFIRQQQAKAQVVQACQLQIFARDVDQTYGTDDK